MDRKEFIGRISAGPCQFRVDRIRGTVLGRDFRGEGILTYANERLELSVRLPRGKPVFEPTEGHFPGSEFGKVRGVIDFELPFTAEIPPDQYTVSGNRVFLEFRIFRLCLASPKKNSSRSRAVDITGVLRNYELIACDFATEHLIRNKFVGELSLGSQGNMASGELLPSWDFALSQRGRDVEFHLRKKYTGVATTFSEEKAIAKAFLSATGFFHGQHAHPFTFVHERGVRRVEDWIEPARATIASAHTPFNDRIWYNAKVGQISWDFNEALGLAFRFFHEGSELSIEVAELLRQVRDATPQGLHKRIHNLGVCALLESTINAIFEEKIRTAHADYKEIARFEDAKMALAERFDVLSAKASAEDKRAIERLRGRVGNTDYFDANEKFKAVGDFLQISPADWDQIYRYWKKWRHRLVHRSGRRSTNQKSGDEFWIESRFVGAIYTLTLKLMGYSGFAVTSTFEGKCRKI